MSEIKEHPNKWKNLLSLNRRLATARHQLQSVYVGFMQFRSKSQQGYFVDTGKRILNHVWKGTGVNGAEIIFKK